MSLPAPKGWCPSLFEPMASGDGLLVRVKPRGAVLTAPAARALAAAASRWGNGVIEATSRASLQVRGLSQGAVGPFAAAMVAADLADADAAVERRRVIVATPLAGDDPSASRYAAPVAAALERMLAAETRLGALPSKFGFLVDGGGVLGLVSIAADIRVRLAGELCEVAADGSALVAASSATGVAETAIKLARAFLVLAAHAAPAPRRMRTLVEAVGAEAVFATAGLTAAVPGRPAIAHSSRAAIGWLPYACGERGAFGLGLPFGTMMAADLAALADAAERFGDGTLRLTPWRALVVAGVAPQAAAALRDAGTSRGLIVDPADSRLAVVACPGRPACASATVDTRAAAAALAALGLPGTIHVSGCAKGCAHPGPVAITLVGDNGRYGVVRHGRAADEPAERDLTAAEAMALLCRERREGAAA